MKGYTSIANIQNYLLTNIDLAFQPKVEKWIESVEAYIDNQTGRNFVADTVASIRSYDGNGLQELLIDDCIEITKLEIKTTDGDVILDDLVAGTDYFLEPSNELPKQSIRLYGYRFNKGIQNIKVTAKWGYSEEAPADIEHSATVLAANIIDFSNQSDGEIQTLNVGSYSVSFRDPAKRDDFERVPEVLDAYKKYDF
jgi:hypothetical protein